VGKTLTDMPKQAPEGAVRGTFAWRVLAPLLSLGGYALTLGILAWGFSTGAFHIPGGDALIWDRVGDALRSGAEVYVRTPTLSDTFWYSPPWAVLFAVVSWLPVQVTALAIIVCEVASLRYIAGSWLRVGYLCWFPLVAFELPSSQFNLIMAAAIAAALRGDPRLAVVMGTAKLGPILAIRDGWRRAVPVGLLLCVVTIPWLGLWPAWVGHLMSSYGANLAPGATILIPFAPRLMVALALVLYGRPWARGLAAMVAVPSLYWVSAVMLLGLAGDARRGGAVAQASSPLTSPPGVLGRSRCPDPPPVRRPGS